MQIIQCHVIPVPYCTCAYAQNALGPLADLQMLGLACCAVTLCRLLDQEEIVYILTLGVTEQYRHLGVASQLIMKVIQYAQGRLCRAVYLHVIDYNEAALNLYARNKFEVLATLRNFYHIE